MNRDELAEELFKVRMGNPPAAPIALYWFKMADRAIELLGQPVKPERRKIVQMFEYDGDVCALCDDGTSWWWHKTLRTWQPLFSEIPQPSQEPA